MKVIGIKSVVIGLTSLLMASMLSCSSEEAPAENTIWDVAPVSFRIEVEDNQGNVIDSQSAEWQSVLENMSVEYEGDIYTATDLLVSGPEFGSNGSQTQSRAIPAVFYGLYYYGNAETNPLYFGEFSRTENFDLEFNINWPDGTRSEVKFENKFEWKNQAPKTSSILWLDGDQQPKSHTITHRLAKGIF